MSKKVLVTGADGFIGSHLVDLLIDNGINVRAFCFYNSNSSLGWLDNLSKEKREKIEFFLGDIRDQLCVKTAMKDCDEVYHLAALIGIPYSYIAPSSYIETNISGTLNVVQSARELELSRVIITSTSETYGTAQFVPITEEHPQVGQSPYAASKIGADQIAMSYYKSFKTPITILRPFNTYGPRQSCRAVIPTIITQIAKKKNIISLGSLSPTRDFNYVLDTCNAFLEISKSKDAIGRVINMASSFEISIGNTASLIKEIMNSNIEIVSDNERIRPENSEVNRLFGDNKLLKQLTSWEPKYGGIEGFKKGLEKTIEWFTNTENLLLYKNDFYKIWLLKFR